jgi:hypothetical protein
MSRLNRNQALEERGRRSDRPRHGRVDRRAFGLHDARARIARRKRAGVRRRRKRDDGVRAADPRRARPGDMTGIRRGTRDGAPTRRRDRRETRQARVVRVGGAGRRERAGDGAAGRARARLADSPCSTRAAVDDRRAEAIGAANADVTRWTGAQELAGADLWPLERVDHRRGHDGRRRGAHGAGSAGRGLTAP